MLRGISFHNFTILSQVQLGITAAELVATPPDAERVGQQGLDNITALIGRNSTGKSSVFAGLGFVRDIVVQGLPAAATAGGRGGFAKLLSKSMPWAVTAEQPTEMSFELLFEQKPQTCFLSYRLLCALDLHQRPYIKAETLSRIRAQQGQWEQQIVLQSEAGSGFITAEKFGQHEFKLLDCKYTALALFGRMLQYQEACWLFSRLSHWYVCKLDLQNKELNNNREQGGHKHLNEACDNVKNVLRYLKQEDSSRYKNLRRNIAERLPDYKRIGDDFLDGGISSGNLKLFVLLLLLNDPRPLICLDEPDLGLYHDMVEALVLEMREYSLEHKQAQIILTTHNPVLLDGFTPQEVWALEKVAEQPSLRARQLACDPVVAAMAAEGISLGALWYGGHLGLK